MDERTPKLYIENITKASAYFIFRNGPISELHKNGKISDEEVKQIQLYMQNHLAYLYTVLLEENDLKKFELVVNTMNKFYVNDEEKITISDDGFDEFYKKLFPSIEIKL